MSIINDILVDKLFKDPPKRTKEIPLLSEKTVSGDGAVVIKDAYPDMRLQGLNIYGKSTQQTTTGAQLFDVNSEPKSNRIQDIQIVDGGFVWNEINENAYSTNRYLIALEKNTQYEVSVQDITPNCNVQISDYFQGDVESVNVYINFENKTAKFNSAEYTELTVSLYCTKKQNNCKVTKIMIQKAEKNIIWEQFTGGKPSPSPEYPQEIKSAGDKGNIKVDVTGKNLIDFDKHYGHLKVGDEFIGRSGKFYLVKVPLPKMFIGKKLTFSALIYEKNNNSNLRCAAIIDGKTLDGNIPKRINEWALSKISFVMKNETDFIMINYSYSADVIVKNIQLEYGSEVTPYEPYKPFQSLILQTPNGLPGIKVDSGGNYTDETGQQWICDEIDLERGKYVQRIWNKIFDGSEDFYTYLNVEFAGFMIGGLPEPMNRRIGLSNIMLVETEVSNGEGIWLGVNNNNIYCKNNRFYDDSLEDKGLANWKAFLAQNPMEIVTYITTPIEHDLPSEVIEQYKQLHTNYPTTTVMNDVGAGMGVTYMKPDYIPTQQSALRMWFKENPII